MALAHARGEHARQGGVVDSHHLARWRLDLHGEIRRIGWQRIQVGRERLRFLQIGRLGGLLRIAKPGPIQEHLSLLASRQIGEALGAAGTFEGEETITVDAGKPDEGLLQLLAAHALDRIAPEALDPSDDAHVRTSPDDTLPIASETASKVLPSGFADGKFLPFLIQHVKTLVGTDHADAGEREVEPAREGCDLGPTLRGRREQQLVVIAAR